MQPTQQLVDDIYRAKVLRARRQSVEEKLAGGIQLFEEVCGRMRDGIRMQFPHADSSEVEQILKQRLARLRKVEEYGIYHPVQGPVE
jgi:hypothetical protein